MSIALDNLSNLLEQLRHQNSLPYDFSCKSQIAKSKIYQLVRDEFASTEYFESHIY